MPVLSLIANPADRELDAALAGLPNIPASDVPVGPETRTWAE